MVLIRGEGVIIRREEIESRWEKMMKGREERYNSIEINDDLDRVYENKCKSLPMILVE